MMIWLFMLLTPADALPHFARWPMAQESYAEEPDDHREVIRRLQVI